jgi:hypothetical protein
VMAAVQSLFSLTLSLSHQTMVTHDVFVGRYKMSCLWLFFILCWEVCARLLTRTFRLGIKSAGSEPVSSILQAQHKQASRPSLTRPGAAQPAALNKAKPDVLSATSVASAKVPKSYQPKVGGRPPLPPPSAQGSDGSQTRARRPSLDEGITPVVGPLAAPPARAPTALQIRADALPTAVMAFVAEAGALVEGR